MKKKNKQVVVESKTVVLVSGFWFSGSGSGFLVLGSVSGRRILHQHHLVCVSSRHVTCEQLLLRK